MKNPPEENKKIVGLLTIGQSPRVDVIPEIKPLLGEKAKIVEAGALDDLSSREITEIMSLTPKKAQEILITRLRNGQSVTLPRASVVSLLQKKIKQLEDKGVSVVGLLCTEEFSELKSQVTLLQPARIMADHIASLSPGSSILVVIPLAEQKESVLKKWSFLVGGLGAKRKSNFHQQNRLDYQLLVGVLNPYALPQSLPSALINQGHQANLIVLDCIGYSLNIWRELRQATGQPVLLPRLLLAQQILENIRINMKKY